MSEQPTLSLIFCSPFQKHIITNFRAWVMGIPEFTNAPILSVHCYHSMDNNPREYAVLECNVLSCAPKRTRKTFWILLDVQLNLFRGFDTKDVMEPDGIFASADLNSLLQPGWLATESQSYLSHPNTTELSSVPLSLARIADMYYYCKLQRLSDSTIDCSWLCYTIFACLEQCENCFSITSRWSLCGVDIKPPEIDFESVKHVVDQYVFTDHPTCCGWINSFEWTPQFQSQPSVRSSYARVQNLVRPLQTLHFYNQGTKKRPHDGEDLNDIDPSSRPVPPCPVAKELEFSRKKQRVDQSPGADSDSSLRSETPVSVLEPRVTVINSAMTTSEIVTALGYYGCEDLSHKLDPRSCSEHPICNGGLGDIYRGVIDGSAVAIKTTRMYIMNHDEKYLKYAAKELYTWSKCKHPNVLGLIGLVEFRGQIGMVSEWMGKGDIRSYLSARTETDRCQLCYYISDGLAYLHDINIVHGDLKGANILMSNGGMPMLTDFGNAVLQEHSLQFTESTTRANISPRWTAPEILAGSTSYSRAADVYALGMTCLEIITGKVPFDEYRVDVALSHLIVNEKKIPQRPSARIPSNSRDGDHLWLLLRKCWAYKCEERPSAGEARDLIKPVTQSGLIPLLELSPSQPSKVTN